MGLQIIHFASLWKYGTYSHGREHDRVEENQLDAVMLVLLTNT